MHIPLTEPVSPRYIHINPATNKVHLMVPVVGGQEITTDNTCQSTVTLREFFDGGALRELNAYKEALAFDIGLLEVGSAYRVGKEARLAQIEAYIEAVSAMRLSYSDAITAFLGRPSNLYSIQLRPRAQDGQSLVVNPVFNVNRTNNAAGIPLSPLYNAMHSGFPGIAIAARDPQTTLKQAVVEALPTSPTFDAIQSALTAKCKELFGLDIDFNRYFNRSGVEVIEHVVTKAHIDALMGFDAHPASPEDYIEALVGVCAPAMWTIIPTSPFYNFPSIPAELPADRRARLIAERTERLSMLTQFFLANVNVYCKARGISTQNFGTVLDTASPLSHDLVSVIATALNAGDAVEQAICNFCNVNGDKFDLSRVLTPDDMTAITQTFERTWRTVTATKENPHMDDFMILDKEATGETAKFVTHQGSICVNFADVIDPTAASSNPTYFASVRADFAVHPAEIPPRNESIADELDVDMDTLLARINDEQFERLPAAVKGACRAHPSFQARLFLQDVAKGKQDEAAALLTATPANMQTFLRTPGIFTDYSGRTFDCTAYEYAYWAKDTHMCRMLESHMDEETKALMLTRIDANDAFGLVFQQNGEERRSAHFDLTALGTALQDYIDSYNAWYAVASNWGAMEAAWMAVGKAQRDVPAHVAQEYCRPYRSFCPCPPFNEPTLPRVLTFYNWTTSRDDSWFPLTSSNSGLGFDFGLIRGRAGECEGASGAMARRGDRARMHAAMDLAAVSRLDEVRTADLTLAREHLNPPAISHSRTM